MQKKKYDPFTGKKYVNINCPQRSIDLRKCLEMTPKIL